MSTKISDSNHGAVAAGVDQETLTVHEPLPPPTVWPAAAALGATLLLWGLISSLIITVIGALLTITSIAGWIRDLRHEHKS